MPSIYAPDPARFVNPLRNHRDFRPTARQLAKALLFEHSTWAVGEYRARQWVEAQGGGDETMIGANAVVMKDVPAGHTAMGVPAVMRPTRGTHWLSRDEVL